MKRTPVNAEGAKPRGHTSPEMKTREWVPGNPANRPHNDAPRETSGKLHIAEETYTLRVEESKERGILAAKGKGFPRYRGASCLLQKCRNSATVRRDIYTVYLSTYLPAATYGILPFRRDGKPIPDACPMCSPRARGERIVRESNPVLLAEQVDNISTIIISPRITWEKIYPACVCACCVTRSHFRNREY